MKKYWDKLLPNLPFIIIVWSIGFYTLRQSTKQFNLDKPQDIHNMHLLFLGISFFFILLPFIKTIKIGKYFELERNIKETKEEVKEFKSEIRQSIQMLSTSVTASIGNLNNQITVNLPGNEELRQEIVKLQKQDNQNNQAKLTDIKDELLVDEEDDIAMALARTRIKMETLLRKSLNKRQSIAGTKTTDIKYLGLNSLYKEYMKVNPKAEKNYISFKYFLEIGNAAVHGQKISRKQAESALQIGALILMTLDEK